MKFKNVLLVLFVIIGFSMSSCSSDDDGGGPTGPTVPDGVFDVWNMTLYFQNGDIETDVPCDEDLEYDLRSNGTYSKTSYSEPASGNNCDISVVINGTWEITEDNVLRLTPSSNAFNPETLNLELINNETQLEITRFNGLVEVYNRN